MADNVSDEQHTDGFGPDTEDTDLKIDHFEPKSILDEESVAGEEEDDDEVADFDFSFPSIDAASSPISADDAFHNGQIRPTLPFFDWRVIDDEAAPGQSKVEPVRKFFATEEPEDTVQEIKSAAGLGRKSNSTGSSRLRRFRDLIHRSSSEGKDAFVFLNTTTGSSVKAAEKKEKKAEKKKEKKAPVSASPVPAHETLYGNGKNKAAAAEKRRSYLPYRPGLVGFFTNANGLSKNVHPF